MPFCTLYVSTFSAFSNSTCWLPKWIRQLANIPSAIRVGAHPYPISFAVHFAFLYCLEIYALIRQNIDTKTKYSARTKREMHLPLEKQKHNKKGEENCEEWKDMNDSNCVKQCVKYFATPWKGKLSLESNNGIFSNRFVSYEYIFFVPATFYFHSLRAREKRKLVIVWGRNQTEWKRKKSN